MPGENRTRVLGHPVGDYEENTMRGERGFAEQAPGYLAGHQRAMLHLDLNPARIEYQVDSLVRRSCRRPRLNSHLRKGVNQECLSVHENQDASCSVFGQYRTPNSGVLVPDNPQTVMVGDEVPVIYDRRQPFRAAINTRAGRHVVVLSLITAMGVVGTCFAVHALLTGT
jgi:hypothetical protein